MGKNRLGVASYINEDLRRQALNAGTTGDLFEIIELWKRRNAFEGDYWTGTASDWLSNVMTDETIRPLTVKFTPRSVGMKFKNASRTRDSGIKVLNTDNMGNCYSIDIRRTHVPKAVRIAPAKAAAERD
jgi:hypothetical protein